MSELTDKIKGNWNVVKGKLKRLIGDLLEKILLTQKVRKMSYSRIQKKTGEAKNQLKFIDKL
ncbi:MAG: hypothetical protein R2728_01955 [Chitinophagales bacterium]